MNWQADSESLSTENVSQGQNNVQLLRGKDVFRLFTYQSEEHEKSEKLGDWIGTHFAVEICLKDCKKL